ncbi:MAG: helix-turn-helix transcriptional regulator [Candidatus Aminicenantes bacterium]|nr:MAG: helix-turn-helix transcriptional regulator [Candidatus Aminicenantes bacterium]
MKEPLWKEIGLRLQLVRKRLNLLQKDFARSLDISNASLSEMEAGNAKPRFELIYNMTKKYKVNINYLLHGIGEVFMPEEISRQRGMEINPGHQDFFKEFFHYFNCSHLVRTAMMNYFRAYILEKENLIKKDIVKSRAEE